MPIANCIVAPHCQKTSCTDDSLVDTWARESGVSDEQMTINLIRSNAQLGKPYTVMANLLLPSIWADEEISRLQKGLAEALRLYFEISINEVFISTSIVNSGMVVESGKEVSW